MLTINNTLDGYLKDVEIKGNTIQDAENLADIRSVGDTVEGQELYEIPVLSVGKNLLDYDNPLHTNARYDNNGNLVVDNIANTYKVNVIDGVTYRTQVGLGGSYYTIWKGDKFVGYKVLQGNTIHQFTCDGTYDNVRYSIFHDREQIDSVKMFYIYEGKSAEYEPYIEDKLTILSPVQLERVGDVADRIICKDGVWGVEKNVETVVLNGSESWKTATSLDTDFTQRYYFNFSPNGIMDAKNGCICDVIKGEISGVETYTNIYPHSNGIDIHIKRLKTDSRWGTIDELKTFLSNNNMKFKYATTQPQFIPLPHDQQIKLRTFANKTNISFLTEIEGTIKAQVPKSLGATVNTHTEQINNLNKELDRVKKLEESTVSTVETESDFTTVTETSNGYFEDVKLEGKTLVNLSNLSRRNITITKNDSSCKITPLRQLTSSDVLYLSFNCTSLTFDSAYGIIYSIIYSDGTPTSYKEIPNGKVVGYKQAKIVPKGNVSSIAIYLHSQNSSGSTATISDVVLMYEKDYDTQNPPSYFEGLKSVGQSATTSEDEADEIVVESVNPSGNLFDGYLIPNRSINPNTGVAIENAVFDLSNMITLPSVNKIFTNAEVVGLYDEGSNFISFNTIRNGMLDIPFNAKKCRIRTYARTSDNYTDKLYISINKVEVDHISDKKPLLYYNNETQTWEKPILRQWDSIEKHADGKYYYHQRSGEVVLNGSEDWIKTNSKNTTVIRYRMNLVDKPINTDKYNTLCNILPCKNFNALYEGNNIGICVYAADTNNYVYINSVISELEGFKQWLQANNVTVVYQLAQEKVYECTNIDLITYANETNYIVESGAIVPKTTLKVHNNISNVVSLLQKKVSLLESNVTSYMISQNRLMLASRYNADTVSFKVDVASLRNSFEYDNDLYELILNNILVGKDNYSRDYIENLIIFYWMDFVISDEMYSTLFEIIEEQHNPKVIEEETPLI